ncbi:MULTISPECIES: UDP-2,4-diacetamido-2,4,6-trideoxy-beta-L-altropyranose hydrolase [Clostridium]|uniref:UDP-2,4-diacetamido-2,4, 6-trideoxy-beta-L-altropyranose hydrolase n=1 Tax=Clostridium lapidicellarium TaxID=3240931 RepID=A0ABV4E1D1_9CLOT
MDLKIAIRAEGGISIGMGHIMRTLVLARELSLKNKICYICKYSVENRSGILEIQRNGFKVSLFRQSILEVLPNIHADVLITDSYDVNEDYFMKTREFVKHTVYIDDIDSFNYPVDLIINQNINALEFNYPQKYKLLGLKYLMLRDEFRDLPKKHIHEKVEDIMITMGGSDPVEFTRTIVDWIKDLKFNFHVIIGPSFKNKEYFKNKYFKNMKFCFNADMADVMGKCDVTVSASGSSICELLASGVPVIGIVIADNQCGISQKLADMNMIENLGWYYDLNEGRFKNSLAYLCSNYTLRKKRSIGGQKLIDGCGAGRIADFIESNFKNR